MALSIEFTLTDEGYEALKVSNLDEVKALFKAQKLDLIILDINFADGNGYKLCKYII